jgi:hypothetical protein
MNAAHTFLFSAKPRARFSGAAALGAAVSSPPIAFSRKRTSFVP